MAQYLHTARILPGKRDEFAAVVKQGFEMGREGLRALGLKRITCFISEETTDDGGGILVTIYEADEPAAIERLYSNPAVIEGERRNHGTLVMPHSHELVARNTPFLDLKLED
jgi:hypothetical protein